VTGKLASIVFKPESGGREPGLGYHRVPLREARLVVGHGIEGDAKGGKRKRQLNVVSSGVIEELGTEGFGTRPGQLGEQLVIDGVAVERLPIGTRLQIGAVACIELLELRTGCSRFEKHHGRTKEEAAGRLGMMAAVTAAGAIQVGDVVEVLRDVNTVRLP
jgi:MOSC domain-containing protein YiiM